MSLLLSQTSAARVVRAPTVTESDTQRLVRDFGVHPLDADHLLSVPERSGIETQPLYTIITLVLPWPSRHGLVGIDIRFLVAPKWLIVVGDTPEKTVAEIVQSLPSESLDHVDSAAITARCLASLARTVAQTLSHLPVTTETLSALESTGQTIRDWLGSASMTETRLSPDSRQEISLALHRLNSIGTLHPAETHLALAVSHPNRQRRLAVGYVAASAALLLLTLLLRP